MAYRILIGGTVSAPEYAFSDEISMGSIRQTLNMDIVGTELAYDVMDAEIDYEVGAVLLWSPKDYSGVITEDGYYFGTADPGAPDISEVPYGTVCWLLNDSTIICKMYVKQIVQIGKTKYQLETISAVGLLDERQHLGAIYTSTTAGDVLSDIIGNAFPYTVAPAVSSQIVRGALPSGTCRENLHRLMFALGIALDKDANGDPIFTFLDPNAVPTNIPATRIFEAGGSVDFSAPATGVEVAEHSFYQLPGSESEQLFSNLGGVAADHLLVQFADPHFDLTATSGLTINNQGPYYAILTGIGVLSGRAYTHNTRTQQLAVADPSGDENIITSTEDTLVNLLNSENVARRLLAYYASKRTVKRTVQLDAEKPGQSVILADAFGVSAQGYIAASDVRIGSRMRKSELTIISEYTPTGQGNNYTTMTRITASGSWTVPAGVTRIRIVVIGGGTGGSGGHNGQAGRGGDKRYGGWQTYREEYDEDFQLYRIVTGYANSDGDAAGNGGTGGAGGAGGAFASIDLDVTPGEIFSATVGTGGAGGAAAAYGGSESSGSAGSATSVTSTHGTITSSDGQAVPEGYYDPLNNVVYAATGESGVAGGSGGRTTITANNGFSGNSLDGVKGRSGAAVGTHAGGAGGAGIFERVNDDERNAGGGGGGGAAIGAVGGAGGDAAYSSGMYTGGNGGNGANAAAPAAASYGCGGNGGNGGGGGGNAGGADLWFDLEGKSAFPGTGGGGGSGSAGGTGGAGCVLIYY